jgi:FkbM family methyltransferase
VHSLRTAYDERGQKVERLHARVEELTARIDRMRATLERSKFFDPGGWERELRARLRLETGTSRTEPHPAAAAAEARLAAVSPQYIDARDQWRRGEYPDGITRVETEGLRFSVLPDAGSEGSLSQRIARGWLPLGDVAFMRRFVVGGVMLDIGANVGTTCIPRIVLGDFAAAFAAEPDEQNFRCLVGNVIDNGLAGRICPDRVAISNANGVARLKRSARIGGHYLLAAESAGHGKVAEVAAFTLDAWLERLAVPLDEVRFVKVDTQGWDVHVLAGAGALLRRRRAVWQIEVSESTMKIAGVTVAELCALVAAHFTHVRELGDWTDRDGQPAADMAGILAGVSGTRRFTNLLLYNAS